MMDTGNLILYQDDSLLVVNKPAGLRTIPDGYDPTLPYLSGMLQEQFGRVWVVHRLDKDTSGVILFARTAKAHKSLNEQFAQRDTHEQGLRKEYHVIVVGMPEFEKTQITFPVRVNGDRKHRTVIDHQLGKPAQTDLIVARQLGLFTLISAFLHSGYTHQIRAHCAAIGLPLLNDPLYRSLKPVSQAQIRAQEISLTLPIRRTALHAYRITFQHPESLEELAFAAPYPPDFQSTLETLEKAA